MPLHAFARPTVTVLLHYVKTFVGTLVRSFGLGDRLVSGIGLLSFGVHPPQKGISLGCSRASLVDMRQELSTFTSARPIRVAADLARPV